MSSAYCPQPEHAARSSQPRPRRRLRNPRAPSPALRIRVLARDEVPALTGLMARRVSAVEAYGLAVGRKARHFVLSSWLRVVRDPATGVARAATESEILDDLKESFRTLKHTRVFREIEAAAWAFADHDRPHLHLAVVLPRGRSIREMRLAWSAGYIPHPHEVYWGAGLGSYFARQRAVGDAKLPGRRRFHGWRAPPVEHFTTTTSTASSQVAPSGSSGSSPATPSPVPQGSRMGPPERPHVAPPAAPTCCERSQEELGQRHEPPLGAQRATPDLDGLVPSRGRRPGGRTMTRTVEGRGGGRVPPCGSELVHPPDAHPDHDARHHESDIRMTTGEHPPGAPLTPLKKLVWRRVVHGWTSPMPEGWDPSMLSISDRIGIATHTIL